MLKFDKGTNALGAEVPTHEKTGLFFPQYIVLPGALAGQVQLMAAPASGIPMRDYFAAKAIETAWQESLPTPTGKADWDDIASKAYRIADAMLKARGATVDNKGFPYTDGSL